MCQWCVSVKAGSGSTGEIPILVLNSIHISNTRASNIMIADACDERTGSREMELMAFPCASQPLHRLIMLKFLVLVPRLQRG